LDFIFPLLINFFALMRECDLLISPYMNVFKAIKQRKYIVLDVNLLAFKFVFIGFSKVLFHPSKCKRAIYV